MKNSKKKIVIGDQSSGSKKFIKVYTIDSEKFGPNVYIQANIHGPEIAGIPVVLKLKKFLEKNLQNGSVVFVPSANPWGLDTKIGEKQMGYTNFNDDKFANWNRIFCDLSLNKKEIEDLLSNPDTDVIEEKLIGKLEIKYLTKKKSLALKKEDILSYNLQKLSISADVLIDLHTAGNNIKHVYTFKHQIEGAKSFLISDLILLPYEFNKVFDESFILPWFNLHKKKVIKQIPKEAYTVELFGDGYSSEGETEMNFTKIVNFLASKKMVSQGPNNKPRSFYQTKIKDKKHICSPAGGIFHSDVELDQTVKKGHVLGKILTTEKEIVIKSPFNGKVYQLPPCSSVETGQSLIGMFTNVKTI